MNKLKGPEGFKSKVTTDSDVDNYQEENITSEEEEEEEYK